MIEEFKLWLQENATFYSSLDTALERMLPTSRILAVGPFATIAAAIAKGCGAGHEVALYRAGEEALADFRGNIDPESAVPHLDQLEGSWDLVYAPMYIGHIAKKELVGFLFDVYDSLEKGGHFIFSFEDSIRVDLGDEKPIPLWFCQEEMATKYYTVQDMLNTLLTIGFKIAAIDEVDGDGIIHQHLRRMPPLLQVGDELSHRQV